MINMLLQITFGFLVGAVIFGLFYAFDWLKKH